MREFILGIIVGAVLNDVGLFILLKIFLREERPDSTTS